jgi:diguanylate cyclase (GGDEF)-like protein
MGWAILKRLVGSLDIGETDGQAGSAIVAVRYRALQRQIPWLYSIILTNYIGFNLIVGIDFPRAQHRINLLVIVVICRLLYWLRLHNRELPQAEMLHELRKTYAFTALLSTLFAFWAIRLSLIADSVQLSYIVFFASLGAISAAYGLSSFPKAARLPLLLLAIPMAVRLILSGEPHTIAMGISLGLVTMLLLHLLKVHNVGFTELVRSRTLIEDERERAQQAEEIALLEQAKAREVASTDPLTGLANRRAMLAALAAQMSQAARRRPITLALVDLDGFKPINDTFGHATGDAVLCEVGERLRLIAGAGGLVARMGGDEFALLVPHCNGRGNATRLGGRISSELRRPYAIDGREFRISGGCGLVLIESEERDLTLALSRCDTALYAAKERGRGEFALFTAEMERVTRRRAVLERALREPDVADEIHLVYQPIFEIETCRLHSLEALARWQHPELGLITPGEFIPITEQINAVEAIGATLLERGAAEAAAHWPDAVRLSFNLSAVQLCSANSAARILATVGGAGLDPTRLQLEVTETALLVDFASARRNLRLLRRAGARIVLDDFGAGFASLSYLREIDFDAIKLDGALIAKAPESQSAMRLLRGVLELCASLAVPCIAEHIETEEQLALLRRLGCRYGQGFLLGRPMSAAEARDMARAVVLPMERPEGGKGSATA